MSATPDSMHGVVLRLSPGVTFTADHEGRPRAEIRRGESTTRFAIDPHIQTFLECFRQPLTLREAAATLAAQGFASDNVLQFGKAMMKTPLLEFDDGAIPVPDAAHILGAAGMTVTTAYKDRKFDGVYGVRDREGAPWIVKLLRGAAGLGVSQRVLQRLQNEYAVLQRLADVPGVVKVRDFVDGDHPYFEMEFVAGATLTDCIMVHSSFERRMAIARAAVDTVAQVHARGVIHGDLHTSNFLVDAAGDLRLIDFDCSFVEGGGYVPRVGGAVHFMPPERMSGDWHVSRGVVPARRSDIYQLGVILYFVLSGVPPYRGSQYALLAAAIQAGDYAPLRQTREGETIPPAIAQAVAGCLSYDPAQRPASLEEILPVFASTVPEPSHP